MPSKMSSDDNVKLLQDNKSAGVLATSAPKGKTIKV